MTTIRYAENRRATVLHIGPPGADGEQGEDGEVQGPVSSVINNVVTFAATDGNSIKDSGVAISALASVAALGTKVDKVTGKNLSENDFTDAFKNKLTALSDGTFRGNYDNEADLVSTVTDAVAGDWAIVIDPVPNPTPDPGEEGILWFWEDVNGVWTKTAPGSTPITSAEMQTRLLTDPDFNILTDARLNLLNSAVQTSTFEASILAISGGTAFAAVLTEATTVRVLSLADMGKYIRLTNVAGCDLTVNNTATVIWPLYPEIRFKVATSGPITITPGAGVTVNYTALLVGMPDGTNFSLKKVDTDVWDVCVGN